MRMAVDTDSLRDLYIDVTGEKAVTERQAEEPSHDPIEGEEGSMAAVSDILRRDGLEDAVAGAETGTSASANS
ncbi:MAG: hypothetical protein ACI9CA_001800 [Natronomonas sp.]|jgi:hypothetical protein